MHQNRCADGAPAILRLSPNAHAAEEQAIALSAWAGDGAVSLVAKSFDGNGAALLIGQIIPGTALQPLHDPVGERIARCIRRLCRVPASSVRGSLPSGIERINGFISANARHPIASTPRLDASPLLRAVQTAEEICRLKKIEVKIAPELTEYHMGIYEGTSSEPGTAGAISDTASKKRWLEENNFDARSPGGESLRDMRDRFVRFVTCTMENHKGEAGIVLMITHGGILTTMLPFTFENLDVSFVQARSIGYLGIIKGELIGGRLICVEYNGIPAPQSDTLSGYVVF